MDIRELIPLHALGLLDATEAAAVERAVAADPSLAAELDSFRDTAHALAAIATPEVFPVGSAGPAASPRPSPDVRSRLFASIGAGRFERFSARVAQLFDVTVDRARELLGLVESSAAWERSAPGIDIIHFSGGAACATADCGFVRIERGSTFPWHTHLGEEVKLILAGKLRDHEGREYATGDQIVMAIGTAHELTCIGDRDAIFMSRAEGGIDVVPRR
jgi:hypothetical protein